MLENRSWKLFMRMPITSRVVSRANASKPAITENTDQFTISLPTSSHKHNIHRPSPNLVVSVRYGDFGEIRAFTTQSCRSSISLCTQLRYGPTE